MRDILPDSRPVLFKRLMSPNKGRLKIYFRLKYTGEAGWNVGVSIFCGIRRHLGTVGEF